MSFTQRIFDFFSRKSTKAKGGGDKAISKQKAGGKMTARERIAALLADIERGRPLSDAAARQPLGQHGAAET